MQNQSPPSHEIFFFKPFIHEEASLFHCNFMIKCWNGYQLSFSGDNSDCDRDITTRHQLTIFKPEGGTCTNLCFEDIDPKDFQKKNADFNDLMKAYNWVIIQQL